VTAALQSSWKTISAALTFVDDDDDDDKTSSMYKTAFLDASKTCSVCVLPQAFSLIHLHGFFNALPWPDSQLPRLGLVNAASASVL